MLVAASMAAVKNDVALLALPPLLRSWSLPAIPPPPAAEADAAEAVGNGDVALDGDRDKGEEDDCMPTAPPPEPRPPPPPPGVPPLLFLAISTGVWLNGTPPITSPPPLPPPPRAAARNPGCAFPRYRTAASEPRIKAQLIAATRATDVRTSAVLSGRSTIASGQHTANRTSHISPLSSAPVLHSLCQPRSAATTRLISQMVRAAASI
ncbi:hypothetical protein Vafri_5150 [Volvox africanus]|uniref:Uncharacterized protein n=1 Tax=Volvox africanus TaxID=51714 RepID=A0A8J4AVW2_9CHLO|nr:hypothetical protein Vafri_5150 [Volvox africanus]